MMASEQSSPDGPPLRKGGPRTRSYTPHVKSGCRTCKIRRVKCDEEKPACRRCHNTGRTCDGYLYGNNHQPTTPPDHQNPNIPRPPVDFSLAFPFTQRPSPSQCSSDPLSIPTKDLFDNEHELWSFNYFRDHTCTRLGHTFQSKLWSETILQACQHEPAIRYAAVALGALHEYLELEAQNYPQKRTEQRCRLSETFHLQQYIKALRLLTTPLKNNEKRAGDVALLACILFVYFEMLRGHYSSVVSHIESAFKIIAELQAASRSVALDPATRVLIAPIIPYTSLLELASIFVRLSSLETQFVIMDNFRLSHRRDIDKSQVIHDADLPATSQSQGRRFKTIDEARSAFSDLQDKIEASTSRGTFQVAGSTSSRSTSISSTKSAQSRSPSPITSTSPANHTTPPALSSRPHTPSPRSKLSIEIRQYAESLHILTHTLTQGKHSHPHTLKPSQPHKSYPQHPLSQPQPQPQSQSQYFALPPSPSPTITTSTSISTLTLTLQELQTLTIHLATQLTNSTVHDSGIQVSSDG